MPCLWHSSTKLKLLLLHNCREGPGRGGEQNCVIFVNPRRHLFKVGAIYIHVPLNIKVLTKVTNIKTPFLQCLYRHAYGTDAKETEKNLTKEQK